MARHNLQCSRHEATLRLIALWVERVIEDADFANRVTLADVVTPDNINLVARGSLFAEYDSERHRTLLAENAAETEPENRLVREWLAPRKGASQ